MTTAGNNLMVRWDEGLCFLCVWSTAALLHSFHPIFFSILLNSVRFYSPPFSFSMAVAKVGRPREAASRKVKEWGSNLTRLMFSSIAEVKLPVLVRRRHLKGFFLRLWRLPCAYYDRASFALFQRNRISGGGRFRSCSQMMSIVKKVWPPTQSFSVFFL